ncbi:NAD-dependent epimerase/dehydratase family protein [Cohnella massiliensis]|uniref:NAD-dependent epimerase/dehydratase family protein n=1 Tax=Cohnella massiliensis TaxID=1816691 RepID=UPI0009BB3428|nr:NAD-dependent epimerase/dehydratase family protein [Cohnella massiliensis]
MKRALITGATGFLGRRLAAALLDRGWEVSGFGRNEAVGAELAQAGVRFIRGDLADPRQVADACAGRQIVFHCGALSSPWGAYRDFYAGNVEGTRNVAAACLAHRVERLVHVSTPSLYFDYRDRLNIPESSPLPSRPANCYAATKRMAEQIVNEAFASGLPSVIVRPRAIFGPGDRTLLPRFIRANEQGGIPLFRGGNIRMDLTYVDNVVHALLLCASAPESALGAAYNITNREPALFIDVLRRLFEALGKPLRLRPLPYPVAYGLAGFLEWKTRLLRSGAEPPLTRYSVGLLGKHQTLDTSLAEEKLGYSPVVGLEEGLERYASWWNRNERQSNERQ